MKEKQWLLETKKIIEEEQKLAIKANTATAKTVWLILNALKIRIKQRINQLPKGETK